MDTYDGPRDAIGRIIILNGVERGAPKAKKQTKGEAKAVAYAAKLAAKAAKEAEAAAKETTKEPKKEKEAKKPKKAEEVLEEDNTPPGAKKDMSKPMASSYSPNHVEAAWDLWWEKQGYYRADETSSKPRYVIMLPPPNVTGTLHIGHASKIQLLGGGE